MSSKNLVLRLVFVTPKNPSFEKIFISKSKQSTRIRSVGALSLPEMWYIDMYMYLGRVIRGM